MKKKPKIYSHSRISTFEQCPYKFKLRYIEKIPPETQSIESHLGSTVHATLEWLYKEISKKKIPEIDEVILFYTKYWENTIKPETVIVKEDLTERDYFNKGVQFILNYYTKNHPFDENTLEVEKKILLDLDPEGEYKIQGFIDRLVYNKATNEYEIHDYKTSNSMPLKEKIEKDRQLALYSIAVKEIFGHDKNICLIWHYLAHNLKIYSRRTNEQLQQLKEETLELIKKIEETEEFPPQKSILCDWCEYKDFCPEFGGTSPKKEKQIKLNGEEDISKEELLDIW